MGMTLQEKGTKTLGKERYAEALDELLLAEEAFALCDPKHIEGVDNIALLLIDIVWCQFQLRQIDRLRQAQDRLARARQALARSHGPNLERLRILHGNFQPTGIYVRLELLEGVAGYYQGQRDAARAHLQAAQDRWQRLQVSDESVAALVAMGFSLSEATRALRFCEHDTSAAADFVVGQRQNAKEQKDKDRLRRKRRREQRSFGTTSKGDLVDLDALGQLEALGYTRVLAAEALRQADNQFQAALDALLDPERSETLQLALISPSAVTPAAMSQLMGMGFSESLTQRALQQCNGDVQQAAEHIMGGMNHVHAMTATTAAGSPSSAEAPGGERDAEMEEELAAGVTNDPLAAYDLSVAEEGRYIREYLALVEDTLP